MEIPTKGSCKWELIPLNFYFKPTLFLFHAMSWINIVRYAQGNARALNPPPRPSRAPPVWGDSPRMLSVAACGAGAPVALHVVHLTPTHPPEPMAMRLAPVRLWFSAAPKGAPHR